MEARDTRWKARLLPACIRIIRAPGVRAAVRIAARKTKNPFACLLKTVSGLIAKGRCIESPFVVGPFPELTIATPDGHTAPGGHAAPDGHAARTPRCLGPSIDERAERARRALHRAPQHPAVWGHCSTSQRSERGERFTVASLKNWLRAEIGASFLSEGQSESALGGPIPLKGGPAPLKGAPTPLKGGRPR
eukprot:gene9559-biopygen182